MSVIRQSWCALLLTCACSDGDDCPDLFVGSVVGGAGELSVGRRVCPEGDLAVVWSALESARASMPPPVRPDRLVVHVEPTSRGAAAIDRIEVHSASGGVLVTADVDLEPTVLVHELAHVRMRGARPSDPMARRLLEAVEEGLADWISATVARTAVVGGREGRDLSHPPPPSTFAWAGLALPGFDPHVLGWQLAARLWRADPRGRLGGDFVSALANPRPWPAVTGAGPTLREILTRCPVRSRSRLAELLETWSPPEVSSTRVLGEVP